MIELHTKKVQQQSQMGKCDLMREYDNYLDEAIKTVSAQQPETMEVLCNQFALC